MADRQDVPRRALDTITRAKRTPPRLEHDQVLQQLLAGLTAAGRRIGTTQAEVAASMWTTPSVVSRIENGRCARPSLTTIERYAHAVGWSVRITLDPVYPR